MNAPDPTKLLPDREWTQQHPDGLRIHVRRRGLLHTRVLDEGADITAETDRLIAEAEAAAQEGQS